MRKIINRMMDILNSFLSFFGLFLVYRRLFLFCFITDDQATDTLSQKDE